MDKLNVIVAIDSSLTLNHSFSHHTLLINYMTRETIIITVIVYLLVHQHHPQHSLNIGWVPCQRVISQVREWQVVIDFHYHYYVKGKRLELVAPPPEVHHNN